MASTEQVPTTQPTTTTSAPTATTTGPGTAAVEDSNPSTIPPPTDTQVANSSASPTVTPSGTVTSATAGSPSTDEVTDKKSKRASGIKGLFNKLKPTKSRGGSTSPGSTPVNTPTDLPFGTTGNAAAGTTTTGAAQPTGDHPGEIIPHNARQPGAKPVVPLSPTRHKGVLGEVDLLVTKEAEKVMGAMAQIVENSGKNEASGDAPVGVRDTLYPHTTKSHELAVPNVKWLDNWGATMVDKLFVSHRMGVYVITNRQTGEKIFETMPIFTRLGMHLLFVSTSHEVLDLKAVEKLFDDVSKRQGKIYNNTDPAFVVPHIQAFVKTYSIPMDELLEPDIKKYKTVNAFFARSLKPSARPVTGANDFSIITSPADSRVTVFNNISEAKKFWIKGKEFTLPELLDDPHLAETFGANPSIAIFRLAPQDYHRFHSPVHAKLGKKFHVPGTYYTVNPQAINEDLNVFTANRRDIQVLLAKVSNDPEAAPTPFVLVAVGAMLVGSIGWSKNPGDEVQKGEDIGYFQYGGSTTILIAPEGTVQWDADLVKNSEAVTETLVRVGEKIGTAIGNGQMTTAASGNWSSAVVPPPASTTV